VAARWEAEALAGAAARAEHTGRYLCFEVSDTGEGISADLLGRLFTDYTQGTEATMFRRSGGTGLGLSICHRQVATLGGQIGAMSELGRGSTFWFTVPLVPVTLPPAVAVQEAAQRDAVATDQLLHRLRGETVLLAEDNTINQVVMCKMLRGLGLQCDVVGNGQEAVNMLKNVQYSQRVLLVLMDMQMPLMNGVEATTCIRGMGCSVPVIGFTANAMEEDRRLCMRSGMNDVLTKPVTRVKLLGVLASIISDHDAHSTLSTRSGRSNGICRD